MPKTINLKDLSIPELKVEAFDRLAWEQKNKKELDMILAEISSRNDQQEQKAKDIVKDVDQVFADRPKQDSSGT